MLLSSAAAGFVTSAGLIIAIGAQNAFVLRQGVQRSHVGLVVAVCMASDMALIVCGVAGMGALVLAWPQLLQGLRFGGAAVMACWPRTGPGAARGLCSPAKASRKAAAVCCWPVWRSPFSIRMCTWIRWC